MTEDFATRRHNMVEGQIKPNRVASTAVVEAFRAVPRELFVPKSARGVAYADVDVRIADNRFLLKPMVLARMIEEATVDRSDMALVVGCATGYATAVVAALADTVIGIEGDPDLAQTASDIMSQQALDNAIILNQDPKAGHAAQQPYGVILIDGAVAEVPAVLLDQLAEGGRLVGVLADRDGVMGQAVLYTRISGVTSRRVLFEAAAPVLPGFEPVPVFEF